MFPLASKVDSGVDLAFLEVFLISSLYLSERICKGSTPLSSSWCSISMMDSKVGRDSILVDLSLLAPMLFIPTRAHPRRDVSSATTARPPSTFLIERRQHFGRMRLLAGIT